MECLNYKEDGVTLAIKIIPNSSKNELVMTDSCLRLKITAPPVDNKANKFVIMFLSKLFKVPKTSIKILRGETSREKVLFFSVDVSKADFIRDIISSL